MAFKIIKYYKRHPKDFDISLEFELKVNINQQGVFTTYLPDNIRSDFEKAGIVLEYNPDRRTKRGFFSSQTYNGIKVEIDKAVEEYFSRELTEEKLVIRYDIRTTCSYSINAAGDIVPNCCNYDWGVDGEELDWKSGTVEQHASKRRASGILVYAKAFKKQTFKYKTGEVKIEFIEIYSNGLSKEMDGKYLYHLSSFASMCPPGAEGFGGGSSADLKELDYTEDTAKFFVDLLTSICNINEKIKDKLDPKSIKALIANGQKLLA